MQQAKVDNWETEKYRMKSINTGKQTGLYQTDLLEEILIEGDAQYSIEEMIAELEPQTAMA